MKFQKHKKIKKRAETSFIKLIERIKEDLIYKVMTTKEIKSRINKEEQLKQLFFFYFPSNLIKLKSNTENKNTIYRFQWDIFSEKYNTKHKMQCQG